ncbi:kinase [Asticcacaulis excentricus]|uniref:Cytosolic protein n=1 Tax=Asticcacaulis excentricus (strain ATCC 15261 / DSM 4724 / KCTC 12464 / NCIMB 9791 / VKM B-1370 / CB 48) TaxID=573065 RepID=E8RVM3_ASTEC|nr:kinase [Asticcacaulis excentricus]ADU15192.1 cytosolic protein [Asticcacaulis excentricus CB 48]
MTPLPDLPAARLVIDAIARWRDEGARLIGLCGAQGCGKSTIAEGVRQTFTERGLRVAVLSLDDLCLPPDKRPVSAHPLFATRGVPGTHDVGLGVSVLDALKGGEGVALPRFDKATDHPLPRHDWPRITAPDLILFEGWCVGARPQSESAIRTPVNALERDEDPDGVWRAYVNQQLAGPYADLFTRMDRLILLAAPGFEVVQGWRTQQEDALRQRLQAESRDTSGLMQAAALARFIAHYERLTQHILEDMPRYANLTIRFNSDRSVDQF